jgi:hypothetical protein
MLALYKIRTMKYQMIAAIAAIGIIAGMGLAFQPAQAYWGGGYGGYGYGCHHHYDDGGDNNQQQGTTIVINNNNNGGNNGGY